MNLKLEERVLDLGNDSEGKFLYQKYVNKAGWGKMHWQSSYNKAYCVYTSSMNNEPQNIIFRLIPDENEYPLLFNQYIDHSKPRNLLDTQFLISFYLQYYSQESHCKNQGLHPWEALDKLRLEPDQLLDGFLAESRGLLMWDYQYLQLLDFVGPEFTFHHPNILWHLGLEAPYLWKEIRTVQLNGKSLETMIKNRLVFWHTTEKPLFQSAWILWKYLTNQIQ